MAKLEQRKGLHGGFKPGHTGRHGTGKLKNTVKRKAGELKIAIGDAVSDVKKGIETRKTEKATEELAAEGSSKNPRFLQDALNPAQNAAMTAGGSRPMTAMGNPQIDLVTGMPITPGGQPNMNPNFIGGMANSNLPTTAMMAQEKAKTIPAQNPGVYKSYDLSKPEPNEFDVKTSSGTRLGSGGDSEVAWRSYANDVANDRTESGKGISAKGFSSLMHLERHGQTGRMNSGPLKSPTEKINDGFSKGYNTYLEKPKVNQDKAMPKGAAGKGIRSLSSNVQEKMGYDPLSQERLTQSRRSTKCMRVKKK